MTDDAVKRAVQSATRNAFRLGRESGPDARKAVSNIEAAIRYSEGLVLPVVQARIEQAIEDAHMAERASERGWDRVAT